MYIEYKRVDEAIDWFTKSREDRALSYGFELYKRLLDWQPDTWPIPTP